MSTPIDTPPSSTNHAAVCHNESKSVYMIKNMRDVMKDSTAAAEEMVLGLGDLDMILTYARMFMTASLKFGGQWVEAEPLLLKSPIHAAQYAAYVLNARWPEAEAVIMTDAYAALFYAQEVIKGRWLDAETIIKQDPYACACYARFCIKGKWIVGTSSRETDTEAMKLIISDPYAALFYARHVVRDRLEDAEPVIEQNIPCAIEYARDVLKGRWTSIEPVILKDFDMILDYVREVIRDRWTDAEETILKMDKPADKFMIYSKIVTSVQKRHDTAASTVKSSSVSVHAEPQKVARGFSSHVKLVPSAGSGGFGGFGRSTRQASSAQSSGPFGVFTSSTVPSTVPRPECVPTRPTLTGGFGRSTQSSIPPSIQSFGGVGSSTARAAQGLSMRPRPITESIIPPGQNMTPRPLGFGRNPSMSAQTSDKTDKTE